MKSDAPRSRRIALRAAALVLLTVLALSFFACGGTKTVRADEGEAIAAAERLANEAALWVRLFCTKDGIPLQKDGRSVGVYREVDGDAMERLGFSRLSDLKAYEARFFSPEMCKTVDAALFSGGLGWKAALIENTAIEEVDGEPTTVFVCLLADPDELPWLPSDEAVCDFSAATVTKNLGDRVSVSVPARGVGASDGKTATKIFDLIRVGDEWYLDNYPNVSFSREEN